MKDYWYAFKIVAYEQRFSLVALILSVAAWILLANIIPTKYLDVFVYAIMGYYWLGGVVVPWVESQLKKLFNENC